MTATSTRSTGQLNLLSTPVLFATDGSEEASGAAAVAAALARQRGATVRAFTVFEPTAFPYAPVEPVAAAGAEALADAAVEAKARSAVLLQVTAFLGEEAARGVTFTRGRAVSTIVREARSNGAGLIVLGLHPHDLFDRIAGEETALRVARTAALPVLAVTPQLRRLPRRVVVGIDFSPASVRAAREVLALMPDGATVVLAHVRPPLSQRDRQESSANYSLGVGNALSRLQQSFPSSPRVTVETVTVEGEPVPELLNLAVRGNAELIAVGSHHHSFVGRMVLGSAVTDLIRAASVSLFVMPPYSTTDS